MYYSTHSSQTNTVFCHLWRKIKVLHHKQINQGELSSPISTGTCMLSETKKQQQQQQQQEQQNKRNKQTTVTTTNFGEY